MPLPDSRSKPYREKNERWIYLKFSTTKMLRQIPMLAKPIRWVWRTAKISAIQLRTAAAALEGKRQGYYGKGFDVNRILWIDPDDIVYVSQKEFPTDTFKGRVIGGDWDLLEKKFENLDVYQAIADVCLNGKNWHETVFYWRVSEKLNNGLVVWGCANLQDFDNRCLTLERLFRSIRQDGYKTQDELALMRGLRGPRPQEEEEIGVNIGRSGDFLFSDGAHRTSIAKVLKLQKIPVKVVIRHPVWAEFRKNLLRYARKCGAQRVQPAPHPDLIDVPHNPDYERLLEAIRQDLQVSNGLILDIGAQLGYFCHCFEEQGLECCALEERQEEQVFLKVLRQAGKRQFQIIEGPVASFEPQPDRVFDGVLILDDLCQPDTIKNALPGLLACLCRLSFRRLYARNPGGPMIAEKSPLAVLVNQLGLKYVRPLMQTADGSTLYCAS